MKYSIKKYTRRRCYNKNKKKSSKRRNIKKHYSRRRITLHKKTKIHKQRKTKKMYQYGGFWVDRLGITHDGDPPTDAAADMEEDMEESTDADASAAAAADAAAHAAGISDDQVPSFTGEVGETYYIEVPLSPSGEDVRQSDEDLEVSKQELLKIFREFPDVLSSIGISPQGAATKADDVVKNIEQKALCGECSPGSACVFDRPKQNQLYGKLLEMIFAILKVGLRGDALSTFFRLRPCEPFDIPVNLTTGEHIPALYRNCAISIKTLLDKKEKLVSRTTPSTGRIACGDAAIFLNSLRQSLVERFYLKMVVIDYYLEKNEKTDRTSSVVPRIMAVYDITTNWELIFGSLKPDAVIRDVTDLKERIANAQDPTHTEAQREDVLSGIRTSVIEYNVYMANNRSKLCLAYKESDKCKYVTPGKKKPQLRLQVSIVAGNVTIPNKDFEDIWRRFGYTGPQMIEGIQPESHGLDPFPPQIMGTPTTASQPVTLKKWQQQYALAIGHSLDVSGQHTSSIARRNRKKTSTGAVARPNPSEKKLQKKLLEELQNPQ